MTNDIPKIIHYCWFGGNKLSDEAIKCINSWKKFFPDYKIIEWNEKNFDLTLCRYVQEAYNQKKWAFVSDFVRHYVLYKYGGVYFDTDVEIIKDMEPILAKGAYFAREQKRDGGKVASGLGCAMEPNNTINKEIIDSYYSDSFLKEDGSENQFTVVNRVTDILNKHGFNLDDDRIQKVYNIYIYPGEYFCPMGYDGIKNINENTYSIHLYNASWFSNLERKVFHLSMKRNTVGSLRKFIYMICITVLVKYDNLHKKIKGKKKC